MVYKLWYELNNEMLMVTIHYNYVISSVNSTLLSSLGPETFPLIFGPWNLPTHIWALKPSVSYLGPETFHLIFGCQNPFLSLLWTLDHSFYNNLALKFVTFPELKLFCMLRVRIRGYSVFLGPDPRMFCVFRTDPRIFCILTSGSENICIFRSRSKNILYS